MPFLPLLMAKKAKAFAAARLHIWKFANHCQGRFRGDARFDLQNVSAGFAPRIDDSTDDAELLERICGAYIRAVQQQKSAPPAYQASESARQLQNTALQPLISALLSRNISALRQMLRNFYRDSCSAGLLGAPNNMRKAYFGGKMRDVYRRFYLGHVLYRLDYWKEQTEGRFALRDLAGPGVGNPFGVLLDGTHISVGSEYAHYCAYRIRSLLPSEKATVAEIAGGFGGAAYYLLRDCPVTYLDFDIPERIALASYYLTKAFPERKFLFYGEEPLTRQALARTDVVLLPLFELPAMPTAHADVTFNSHTLSNLSPESLSEYLWQIARITRGTFLFLANRPTCETVAAWIARNAKSLSPSGSRPSGWHSHKVSGAGVGGAAGLAASEAFEQYYLQTETVRLASQESHLAERHLEGSGKPLQNAAAGSK